MEFWQLLKMTGRNWKLIAVLLIVCLGASLFVSFNKVSFYDASTILRVSLTSNSPTEGYYDFDSKMAVFNSVLETATSDQALRSVADKNGMTNSNIRSLRQLTKIAQVNKSEFVKMTISNVDPATAVNFVNDLAAYTRDVTNRNFTDKLNRQIVFQEGQLKAAQNSYTDANQTYDEARKKYDDLQAKSQQELGDQRSRQIADANNRLTAAQNDYTAATQALPRDVAAIEIARGKLDRAQKELDALQQSAFNPLDSGRQARQDAELSQAAGLDEALNRQKAAQTRINDIKTQIDQIKALQNSPGLNLGAVSVSEPARSAELQPSQLPLFVGLALAVALALGISISVLLAYIDRRIYSLGVARDLYRQTVLGGIPFFRANSPRKSSKSKATALPANALPEETMESFRRLANTVVERHRNELPLGLPTATNLADGLKADNAETALATLPQEVTLASANAPLGLLIAGDLPGVGKTTVVANLGIALAEAGYRTLLIDANRKNPTLHIGLCPDEAGKEAVKTKEKNEATQVCSIYPELDLLPFAALPTQPSGVIRPADLAALLAKLANRYQIIICDTPAMSEASDAISLLQHFPNIMYVVDGRKPKVEADQERLESLTTGNALLSGLVINRMQKQTQ